MSLEGVAAGHQRRSLEYHFVFLPQGMKALANRVDVSVWGGDEHKIGVGNGRLVFLGRPAAKKKNRL